MPECFKNCLFLLGRQMYNLKPARKNFSSNNLFTPTFLSIIKQSFKKRPRRYAAMDSFQNFLTSMEEWKYGSMEVQTFN